MNIRKANKIFSRSVSNWLLRDYFDPKGTKKTFDRLDKILEKVEEREFKRKLKKGIYR